MVGAATGVPEAAPPRRLTVRAAELLAGAVLRALRAIEAAPPTARSSARRSAASCSVWRSGEGDPAGDVVANPSSAGERMPLGVVWRLAGVEASGVLLMVPSSLPA